ncbi:hypothetical protein GQ54DRAFT_82731 [Martensiomyces pterosporus]|nr:hypothetical protein GQ54DRAFT_82731 [Martensiomyces pterosporus]
MESTAAQFARLMSTFIENELNQGIISTSHVEPGKLARLSSLQFQELATDVYDELNRRMNEAHEGMPFLPVRDHYHPKRNQARQKLATLSRPKFVDLVQDVNAELKRRFPQQTASTQSSAPSTSRGNTPSGPGYGPGSQQSAQGMQPSSQYSSYSAQPSSAPPKQMYSQYQPGRSPPVSGGSMGGGSNERSLDSVDRVASDLNNAIQISQQGSAGRMPTPDERMVMRHPSSDIEKLRNEYEMRLSAMRKRIGQLESQMLDYRMNDSPDKNVEELNNIGRLNSVLTQKNERLENEVKLLRDQLVATKTEVPALRAENEQLRRDKAQLVEHERNLKRELDDARTKIRKLKTTSVFAKDHQGGDLDPPPKLVITEGVIRKTSVVGFQSAVDKLLLATRSETIDGDLPPAGDAVERACQELKADVRAYEAAHARDANAWPMAAGVKNGGLAQAVRQLDESLGGLTSAIYSHLDSMGVSPVSLLEAAASHLATSVVSLVKLLKVCHSDDKAPPRLPGEELSSIQQVDVLRQYLEEKTDAIVDGIQTMLRIVRATNPDPTTLFTTLQSVITSARTIIDACRPVFTEIGSDPDLAARMGSTAYDPGKASHVLEGLENGHLQLNDQLNDINEAQEAADDNDLDNPIVRELLSDTAFKQRLTSAVFDVAKFTKMLMALLE